MIFLLTMLFVLFSSLLAKPADGFVDIAKVDPSIHVEMRYNTNWNFIGHKINGYQANKCYLSTEAANALSKVQAYLKPQGYALLVFDCYRPQRAVNQFIAWTKDAKEDKMKKIFYPDEPKEHLIDRGYIAAQSSHSRGSTVDITIVKSSDVKSKLRGFNFQEKMADCRRHKNSENAQLNMGTGFDCFSNLAVTDHPEISEEAKKNRQLLKSSMEKFGFVNYPQEWWHYTLKNEPFRTQYFDFVVE